MVGLVNGKSNDAEGQGSALKKPRVLILGDSISIGYTPFVQNMLAEEAVVIRPTRTERNTPENCAGTDSGIANIDRWLKIDGGNWDVIHFNWGLHDLKHVDPTTGKNSKKLTDPFQSDPADYEKQLREIVEKLKRTGAELICCTTTPVPPGCEPLRNADAQEEYNRIATRIAKENDIPINDLCAFAKPQLKKIQRPADVHFSPAGSKVLAEKVAAEIRSALEIRNSK